MGIIGEVEAQGFNASIEHNTPVQYLGKSKYQKVL